MSELQLFKFEDVEVRTVVKEGVPFFVARDVCNVLGIKLDGNTLAPINDDWKGSGKFPTPGGEQNFITLNEQAIYKLAFRSRKPEAEKFTDWIAADVLPSIRKTGSYITPSAPPTHVEALRGWADALEVVETQKKALELAAPKVAFADAVNDSSNSMDLGVFAKILGTGRTRLFEWLREQGYLMATGTKPYQKYLDNGYFVVIETTFARGDTTQTYGKTQICGKGQLAIEKRFREI